MQRVGSAEGGTAQQAMALVEASDATGDAPVASSLSSRPAGTDAFRVAKSTTGSSSFLRGQAA
eukprot:scaffold1387_cov260-Pinguiococcus_pyrenoidosus.AAC.15